MSKSRCQRITVLMGGPSSEREISLRSGAAIADGLEAAGYTVTRVDVPGREVVLPEGTEAVFLAFHGEFGEDGQVQAILNQMHMPYTGTGAAASRVAFDKVLTKQELEKAGVSTPPYEVLHAGDVRTLPLPVVVKPVAEGSSIGVHRVFEEKDWEPAFADVLSHGGQALVESFIEGRELTVGILDGEPLPIVEIRAPGGWYGYEAKYTKGQSSYHVPAELSEAERTACTETGVKAFKCVGCRGAARVDIRLNSEGTPYVLEINTIPGFTGTSLLPMAAGAAGISFSELCSRIIQLACYDAA